MVSVAPKNFKTGVIAFTLPQCTGYKVARALTEIECYGLYERHIGECDSEGGDGLGVDLSDEIGVSEIIYS